MKKNIVPSRTIQYDGRGLLVFDDLFSKKFIEAMSFFVTSRPFSLRPSFDNEFSTVIELSFLKDNPELFSKIEFIIDNLYPQFSKKTTVQHFSHMYAAAVKFGDSTIVHSDIPCNNCLTFLYYANSTWNGEWGGETVFYDNNKDAIAAVTPKPGRMVAFNASLFHRTGVPNRLAPTFRYTLSIFCRCKKFLNK